MAAKKATKKRVKKDDLLRVRVTPDQKAMFLAASERSGLTLSSWIVVAALEKAREGR